MARKKTAKKKVTKSQSSDSKTTQFALRLDTELYEKMKKVAGEAEISVNQLVQGICDAAMRNCFVGEAVFNGNFVRIEKTKGCVTFGKKTTTHIVVDGKTIPITDKLDQEDIAQAPEYREEGQMWFGLDYSGRSYRNY